MTALAWTALLHPYRDRWPNEAETIERFEHFVGRYADHLYRTQPLGHVTASAWVVSHDARSVLLLHHRKLGKWIQPGGHADGDACLRAVARREVLEETGLSAFESIGPEPFDLDIHRIPARANEPAHEHYDVRFAFQMSVEQALCANHESLGLAWIAIDRLEAFTDEPSIVRMAVKWRALEHER